MSNRNANGWIPWLLLASNGVASGALPVLVLMAGFCMSGAQTGLNAFAPSCYPTLVRATGVVDDAAAGPAA